MNGIASLPDIRVELDGVPLEPGDRRALVSLLVHQRLSLPTVCELCFTDPGGPLGAGDVLPIGASLQVGLTGDAIPLFVGQVTAVESIYRPGGARELRLRGYDLLHRLRKRQPVCAHSQVSLADLAIELVADLGLSVEAVEHGTVQSTILQAGQSDFEVLAAMADRSGLYFNVREDVLHILTLEGIGDPLPLKLGSSLLEARFEVNGDSACRNVSASGWDPGHASPFQGGATRPRVGRTAIAEAIPANVGGTGERNLVGLITPDVATADALAQAELDARVAREVILTGVAEGDSRLRPGTIVDVRGITPALAGRYVLAAVTHSCDARRGYVSEIDTTPPPDRQRPTGADLTLGIVSRIDDPERLGRVVVSLPACGGIETDWLEVAAQGAGSGKGFMIPPDVDDHVVILFPRDDPARGVVIGGLYGVGGPPDPGIETGAVRRNTLLTRGGQRVLLDDLRRVVRVENNDGSYLELAPDGVRLHASKNLEIAAPGKRVVIRGAAIDFERG